MYAITGASGNIGGAIARKLLAQGEEVCVIGRSAERLESLVDIGAKACVADLRDTKAIAKAFKGAKAVFAMIPPNYSAENFRGFQNEVGKSISIAIQDSGVENVVNLSSVGADKSQGTGVVTGLYDQEQRLNMLGGLNVFHLRPASFMENLLMQVDTVREHGMLAAPQDPDQLIPQIATSDIADYAVDRMTKLDFDGKVTRELLGPTDISMNQVAVAIGNAIGKNDLSFRQVSMDDMRGQMDSMGASSSATDGIVELYEAINNGMCDPTETRSKANTTPTTIENFSKTFADIYRGK